MTRQVVSKPPDGHRHGQAGWKTAAAAISVLICLSACQQSRLPESTPPDTVAATRPVNDRAEAPSGASTDPAARQADSSSGLGRPVARSDAIATSKISRSVADSAKASRVTATTERSDTLTVSSFLAQPLARGQRVMVSGSCLDQFHTRGAAGPPPVARSDWQLVSGQQVVYVVGPQPGECLSGPVTIVATVGVDTVAGFGKRQERRYLILVRK